MNYDNKKKGRGDVLLLGTSYKEKMRSEVELILLGCLAKRTELEELRLNELLEMRQDWAFITGELIRHRVNGNFYTSLSDKQRSYVIGKVRQTLELLSDCYEQYNAFILDFFERLIIKTDEAGIKVAGLKGVIFNSSIYDLRARRSNDIDILVAENNLKKFDSIMREFGFIQSLDKGKTEATRQQKMIQQMNYHDLVPYIKKVDQPLIKSIKVDVNFHFDSKEHDITRRILDEGTQDYIGNGYKTRGLKWTTHLLFLCTHFYREATDSIWTSRASDADLYKIVYVQNSFREYSRDELLDWCKIIDKYELNKQCYFTMYYLNKFYPDKIYAEILERILPEDESYLNKVRVKGGEFIERQVDFFESTFDMKYGKDFSQRDFGKIF